MASLGVKFTWGGGAGDMLVRTVLDWVALSRHTCVVWELSPKGETVSLLILKFLIFRFPNPSEPALSGSLEEVRHSAGKSVSIVLGDLLSLEAIWKN